MIQRLCLAMLLACLPLSLQASPDTPVPDSPTDDAESGKSLDADDLQEALNYSQQELHERFQAGLSLDLGMVLPWAKIGGSFFWQTHSWISSLALGFGDFSYSGNLNQRNYLVSGSSQATHITTRYFIFGSGPIYVEPNLGLVRWDGAIKPRGNDAIDDIAASSLTSRFEAMGFDLGVNVGVMWIFTNGIFLDYNFMQLSKATLLKATYTTNTADARRAVREQIAGFTSMSSVNLRVGYTFDF